MSAGGYGGFQSDPLVGGATLVLFQPSTVTIVCDLRRETVIPSAGPMVYPAHVPPNISDLVGVPAATHPQKSKACQTYRHLQGIGVVAMR